MNASTASVAVEPLAAAQRVKRVIVQSKQIRILQLSIEQPAVVGYLQKIPAEKLEIAFVHAIEVGIVAMHARREGCRQ